MKTVRKPRGKPIKAPAEGRADRGCPGTKKSTKRTYKQFAEATGNASSLKLQGDGFVVERDENSPPCSSADTLCPQRQGTSEKFPMNELHSRKALHPSAKMKLQLFPADEDTRVGLEKDGFHPYLELTLSSWKKISSVIKHLNSKWGSSSSAQGEPVLLPYNKKEHLASCRWTINNNDISAGDVYSAIGSPAVFRLRYGWFCDMETKVCPKMENTCGQGKPVEINSEQFANPIIESEATNAIVMEKISSDAAIQFADNEEKKDDGPFQLSGLWADSLTNISIGGLLSEASLQGRFNNCDRKSNGSNTSLQPTLLISDSFDAFLSGQTNQAQGPRPPPLDSQSSILDAEDTCHAFPFQKLSSLGKEPISLGGDGGCSTSCTFCQDAGSKSFKIPKSAEVSIQSGHPKVHASQESETDLRLCSQVHKDESSLGLSGIKWTDSLGPFDLGLSAKDYWWKQC